MCSCGCERTSPCLCYQPSKGLHGSDYSFRLCPQSLINAEHSLSISVHIPPPSPLSSFFVSTLCWLSSHLHMHMHMLTTRLFFVFVFLHALVCVWHKGPLIETKICWFVYDSSIPTRDILWVYIYIHFTYVYRYLDIQAHTYVCVWYIYIKIFGEYCTFF